MKQVVQTLGGDVRVDDVPAPTAQAARVLVRTVRSLISSGTERQNIQRAQRSLLTKAAEKPELVAQVFQKLRQHGFAKTVSAVTERLDMPVPMGYSAAGIVMEAGPGAPFVPGDRVACAGTDACHAEYLSVPQSLCVSLPQRGQSAVDFESGAFAAVGAVAMHGVRQAEVTVGESVVVLGLGLVGLITVQILKAAGCSVVAADRDRSRTDLARAAGANLAVVVDESGGNAELISAVASLTRWGADAVVITAATESAEPLELAPALLRDRGRVVIVGDAKSVLPRAAYYGKEIDVRFSRSYGPGRYDPLYEQRGIDYPVPYVRWTAARNMSSFLELVADKRVDVARLISHRFHIDDACDAYRLITSGIPQLAVVLRYGSEEQLSIATVPARIQVVADAARRDTGGTVSVGMIGAGSYGRDVLIPLLKKSARVRLHTVATRHGHSARFAASRGGFRYCTSDHNEVIANPEIDCVIIATRHDLHARLVTEALRAGKHVFVEKPLCLTFRELDQIKETLSEVCNRNLVLVVGFNRRHSEFTARTRALYADRRSPLSIVYRINAGAVAADHWTLDDREGGGRIVGEMCHFVDFCDFVVGLPSQPMSAVRLDSDGAIVTLSYPDSSRASIFYVVNGSASVPKERIEVFGAGAAAVIDDFRRGVWATQSGTTRRRSWFGSDKGHKGTLEHFFEAALQQKPVSEETAAILASTETTLRIAAMLGATAAS